MWRRQQFSLEIIFIAPERWNIDNTSATRNLETGFSQRDVVPSNTKEERRWKVKQKEYCVSAILK